MRKTILDDETIPLDSHLPAVADSCYDLPLVVLPSDRHPAAVYLARLAAGSRRTMLGALNTAASLITSGRCDVETMPWHLLRYPHVAALRARVMECYAPATSNKILAAVRGALREAWRLDLMSAADFQRASDIPTVRSSTLPRGRALSAGEIRSLFSVCARDKSAAGSRDAALLALLYGSGLRRSEVVALDFSSYDEESGAITIRAGKGQKDRVVYAATGADQALSAWLGFRGNLSGPLFLPVDKGGHITYRRLTSQSVLYILQKRAAEASVRDCSPHDLRRTMISDLLDAGADIAAVQQLAGHANVQTTVRYDRRGEAAKRKAASLLYVPYGGGRS